jgi:hypothetical protein
MERAFGALLAAAGEVGALRDVYVFRARRGAGVPGGSVSSGEDEDEEYYTA